MSEQAQALGSDSLSDLASYLSDTPETAPIDEDDAPAEESTDELDTDSDADDEQDADDSEESEDEDADPAPVANITFKVKSEDGTEETVELKPDELAGAFLRQRDYTTKTQALAARENEAVKFLQTKHEEVRSHYLQQAEVTRAAVVNMAGIKTDSELADLAQTDPAAWVAENQRQQSIYRYLNQLDQQISGEKQRAEQQQTQAQQQQTAERYEQAWGELSKAGIDKPKLQKIFGDATAAYGFSAEEFGTVYDARIIKVLRDATAYRALQDQKAGVTKKIADAPRMPSKQSNPTQTRVDKATQARFSSGRAKLDDLARLLA